MLVALLITSAFAAAPYDVSDTTPRWIRSEIEEHALPRPDLQLSPTWAVAEPGTLLTGTEVIDLHATPPTQPSTEAPNADARITAEAAGSRSTVARSLVH